MAISAASAQRLAYYKAQYGLGVLAPRGWHCFSTYGSNGSSLFISPDAIDSKALFSDDWKGFSGQAIQISYSSGGTSGRFEVAKVIARVSEKDRDLIPFIVKQVESDAQAEAQ